MIKDYQPSYPEEIVEYRLIFYKDRSGGLAFPCDEHGNVDKSKLFEPAVRNLEYALQNPQDFPYAYNKIDKIVRTVRNPATGICHCGNRIELFNEYLGGCECPYCGQWWNLFGQELKPVERWSEGDDW